MKSDINDHVVTAIDDAAQRPEPAAPGIVTPGGLCGHCLAEHLVDLGDGAVFDLDDARAVRRLADAGLVAAAHHDPRGLDRAS